MIGTIHRTVLLLLLIVGMHPVCINAQHTLPEIQAAVEGPQLRNGQLSGRVTITLYDIKGVVCADNFTHDSAAGLCHLITGQSGSMIGAHPIGRNDRIWVRGLRCPRTVSHIHGCMFDGWQPRNCTTGAAAIRCQGTNVIDHVSNATSPPAPAPPVITVPDNIVTTIEPSGRIIINYQDQGNGTICSDGFDIKDARVLCKMFDLPISPVQVLTFHKGAVGGRVWLSDVQCTGSENSLYACSYRGFNITNCRSASHAGVLCGKPTRSSPCGVRVEQKVIGGTAAAQGMWPWTASLQNATHHHLCGAVVIDRQWVITGAHCVYRLTNSVSSVRVEVGSNTLRAGTHVNVSRIVIHPDYKNIHFKHDIALLRLRQQLTYSRIVQPICLNDEVDELPVNKSCTVAGWGVTGPGQRPSSVLRAASIDIVNDTLCHRLPGYSDEVMLCAGHPTGERDACEGDSGGPLMCRRGNTAVYDLYGTVSAGYPCGTNNSGHAIYVDISHYTAWIRSVVNDNSVYQRSSCEAAPIVEHGQPNSTDTQLNTVVSYNCTVGHWLTHNNPLRCVIDTSGQMRWTPNPPQCSGTGCPPLPYGDGGWPNVTDTSVSTVVAYHCARGYTLSHENLLRCQAQQTGPPKWDNKPPRCMYSRCPELPTVANGWAPASSTEVGSQVVYRCNASFVPSHTSPVTCRVQTRGTPQWVGVPTCTEPIRLGRTQWGNWGPVESCNAGTYVNGFRLRVESYQGVWKDDAAITAIQFHCTDGKILTSYSLYRGSWKAWHYCPNKGSVSGVNLKSEPPQGSTLDDTAANNLNIRCIDKDSIGRWIYGEGLSFGGWDQAHCPAGQRICSLQTLVEPHRGASDDTGVNKLSFTCCGVPPS